MKKFTSLRCVICKEKRLKGQVCSRPNCIKVRRYVVFTREGIEASRGAPCNAKEIISGFSKK